MPFNIFKRKQKEEPKQEPQEQEVAKKEEKKEEPAPRKKTRAKAALPGALLRPHVTEKAGSLAEKGEYVFRVAPSASKGAVKQAVEALYGAGVEQVRFMKKPPRQVRLGRRRGVKPGLKKAVVRLKKGEQIEVISR